MVLEQFKKLLDAGKETSTIHHQCEALLGLVLISKYLPSKGVECAHNNTIYSVMVEDLITAGIVATDVTLLGNYGWMIEDEYLACFV